MFFSQIEFLILWAALAICLYFCQSHRLRKILLLSASYYFYAHWDYRFLTLLVITTVCDYWIGHLLSVTNSVHRRKALLIVSLTVNFGALGFFKYYDFFINSMRTLLMPLDVNLHTLNIILPLGISFYTLQSVTYTIDVYRHRMPACRSILDYAVFVSFFPKLVAGPIVRASYFLPQLNEDRGVVRKNVAMGFNQFVLGLFKKVFIADRLALFVDPVFSNVGVYSTSTIWLAVIAYSLQIYLDFSGYSDMAIGVGRVLGYDLPENFRYPYVSTNISEFWRRWHISLSSWIRDYIYIPLGGNRKGDMRTYLNLMIAMVICGLWHGAAWNFVFWGGLHGALLVAHRGWSKKCGLNTVLDSSSVVFRIIGWGVTLLFVMVGWVFFRSVTMQQAILMIHKMFRFSTGVEWLFPFVLVTLGGTIMTHLMELLQFGKWHRLPLDAWYTMPVIIYAIWLIIVFAPHEFQPFIYAQF